MREMLISLLRFENLLVSFRQDGIDLKQDLHRRLDGYEMIAE